MAAEYSDTEPQATQNTPPTLQQKKTVYFHVYHDFDSPNMLLFSETDGLCVDVRMYKAATYMKAVGQSWGDAVDEVTAEMMNMTLFPADDRGQCLHFNVPNLASAKEFLRVFMAAKEAALLNPPEQWVQRAKQKFAQRVAQQEQTQQQLHQQFQVPHRKKPY